MAKVKKRKLRWEPSLSPQVVGYKLYWSKGDAVHYGSEAMVVGNVTELVVPDDIPDFQLVDGPMVFAVTALDELGNESDLITLPAPYQFSVPQAPEDFWMEAVDGFNADGSADAPEVQPEPIPLFERKLQQLEEEINAEEARTPLMAKGEMKYFRRQFSG